MRSLRNQLILSHALPLLLIIPLMAVALIYLLETQVLLDHLSARVAERADLIARAIQSRADIWQDPERARAFIAEITLTVDGRVALLEPDGNLLAQGGDVELDPHAPEVVDAALSGQSSLIVSYGVFSQRAEIVVPILDTNQQVVGYVGVTDTLESAASGFGTMRRYVVTILSVALVLAVLLGVLLAGRLARPISQAARTVVDIANGRPVQPLEPQGPQEIQDLSQAVNILEERLRLLEEIRRRSLANIVHELGRPLGAVRAAIHVLRRGAGDDPEIRQELLTGVETQIERLEPLLDDLAQLHGQVSGQITLRRQDVDLSEWLPPLLLPWRAAALDKGLAWQAQVPADLPTLSLDPDRMAQVVGNLLSNAIKYTPSGETVTVSAGSNGQEAWICVADSGPGISPEERDRIFEPFYRGQQDQRFPYGLGLGLTIAQDLVLAHGGRLTLAGGPGEGSRFTIHLPLKSSAALDSRIGG